MAELLAMSLCLTPRLDALTQAVTGRAESLFAADCRAKAPRLEAQLASKRVLLVGAAGSIGSATLIEVLARGPATVAVLDPAENNLAELVRTIRGLPQPFRGELTVEPLDYGSPLAERWLSTQPPFDAVLSFAALKHVRSERDAWSVLRLLQVNLVAADRFLGALRRHGHGRASVFFVSTDKAADPINLMGASKRAMEHLLWAHAVAGVPASLLDGGTAPALTQVTTTRFANVAFSDGSLPWGLLQRLDKQQPLAVPEGVRRFLISPTEAGQLCLLAAFACPHRHVLVPRLDPVRHAVDFLTVASAVLTERGLSPRHYRSGGEALAALPGDLASGHYPLVLTPADTTGEKGIETFVAAGEAAGEIGLGAASVVAAPRAAAEGLADLLGWVDAICNGRSAVPDKAAIVAQLGRVVPELAHAETGRSLDGRM